MIGGLLIGMHQQLKAQALIKGDAPLGCFALRRHHFEHNRKGRFGQKRFKKATSLSTVSVLWSQGKMFDKTVVRKLPPGCKAHYVSVFCFKELDCEVLIFYLS